MQARKWEPWHQDLDYGTVMQQRALGHEPEMEQTKQLVNLFRPYYRPGLSVIDAGCGAGHFYPSLLAVGEQIEYLGIDITKTYIQLARKTFMHDNRAKFAIADLFNMGIANNAFDIGLCYMVLPFIPDYHRAFASLRHLHMHGQRSVFPFYRRLMPYE